MIIGARTAIEPVVGGYAVTVDGIEWRSPASEEAGEQESVFDTAADAWAAYRRANPGEDTGLADMARTMVGDGKRPNLYFVTVDGETLLATADMTVAKHYAERTELMGKASPHSALEYPVQIEDRLFGVVWENGASIAEQEAAEEDERLDDSECPNSAGRHVLAPSVTFVAPASGFGGIVVEVGCARCGRSGSIVIDADDVQW